MSHQYLPIEWRFSGIAPSVYGCDPMVVLAAPALLLGLRESLPWVYFVIVFLFVALCIYASYFSPHNRLIDWINAQRTRYFQRCQWPT